MLQRIKFYNIYIRQNLFKSIISTAKNLSLQPPLIFWVGIFYNNIYLCNFKDISPKHIEDMDADLNNVIFENIPKSQRHYYHGNSKQLNFSIHILYLR